MRLDADEARRRFAPSRVARLATTDEGGRPHLVPIVFALAADDVLYSAVDRKPKSTTKLKRLANIESNPQVAVLADHYDEDWTALWWVRADGTARLVDGERGRRRDRAADRQVLAVRGRSAARAGARSGRAELDRLVGELASRTSGARRR